VKTSIIGLGEVGSGLLAVLKNHYDVKWFDKDSDPHHKCEIMHICVPYSPVFVEIVAHYASLQTPLFIVNHTSVPVGTTEDVGRATKIPCFHSPIMGQHPDMAGGILTYLKHIGTDSFDSVMNEQVLDYFDKAGIRSRLINGTKTTELAKLLELCRYGTYIAFAKEQETICKHFGVSYDVAVKQYEVARSDGLKRLNRAELCQPILYPFKDYVGGHCTVEDMEILLEQINTPLLRQAYEIDRNTKIWENCNIYKTARIGKGCSVGTGTEIGHNVIVGNNVRIGAQCFIPEGVTIEDDCFIAPGVFFSNDKRPPSNRECWGKILVKKGACIGMRSTVLPGVTIGEGAIIGAGAVVTKDIPSGEQWYGIPAMPHGKRK
jgi:UDP-2-acetamido-3-amino-2,3-dideoxy-glucuronate N-acetyltransferase